MGDGFTCFQEIDAWKLSRVLTSDSFRLFRSEKLAREFTLKDQFTRASLSIMNNIAEGFGRPTKVDFARFLSIARASAMEVQSMPYVLQDLEFIDENCFNDLFVKTDRIIRMLGSLAGYLRRQPTQ